MCERVYDEWSVDAEQRKRVNVIVETIFHYTRRGKKLSWMRESVEGGERVCVTHHSLGGERVVVVAQELYATNHTSLHVF